LLLTQRVGSTFEGFQGLAVSITVGAVAIAPLGLGEGLHGLANPTGDWSWWLLLLAVAGAGLLFPVFPYLLEMAVLRRLTPRVFGVMLSLEPAVAALIGLAVLSQALGLGQIAGMFLVICASVAVTVSGRRG
ncbi:EamA family transporter, partial [Streptomyces sp. H27-D2]|uniref:EamA family transporter n=1 Tax=Streptomyces sp. H27-D2 TaxID=3046304 RepID=UPI002DB67B07